MTRNWKAEWIWLERAESRPNTYIDFRRTFTLAAVSGQFELAISSRNQYQLYVNGSFVGRGPSPCDQDWQYYDIYDVTDRLRAEENVIAVVCYHFGEKDIMTEQWQGPAGLIVQLEQDGVPLAYSEAGWNCRLSPRYAHLTNRISKWGGFREIYCANLEDSWMEPGYEDGSWQRAQFLQCACEPGGLWPRLMLREVPFLATEWLMPKAIVRIEANFGSITNADSLLDGSLTDAPPSAVDASHPGAMPSIVFDFAREVVGRPRLNIEAPDGGGVRIAYGESLELEYVDAFILKRGRNKLMPYGRRAFRYMQVSFAATPQPILLESVQFEHVGYPFEQTGAFETDDPLLNRIWKTSHDTTRVNSQEHLEDCPWREGSLWVVDAVVMGKVIYQMFGDSRLLRKCLLQFARIQRPDGSIPGTGPERNTFLLPDFCAYWVLGVADFWRYTGDRDFVEEVWPNLRKVLNWFAAQQDHTGLFAGADRSSWWCFIDWTDAVDKRDKVAAISFLHYKALVTMAGIADTLGKAEEAAQWRFQAAALKKAAREWLWVRERGLYADCVAGEILSGNFSLQTNFLAIWCGLMEPADVEGFMSSAYARGDLPPVRGAFFQHIVLEVLEATGRHEEALRLIRGYWGEMLARGALTWWETFDATSVSCTIPSTYQGNTPTYLQEGPPVSHCHGWGSSPGYMLNRLVLGVDIGELGRGIVSLSRPHAATSWAKGEIPTSLGPIRVAWERAAGGLTGYVEVPEPLHVVCEEGYPLTIRALKVMAARIES